uniref:Uncharacterized protein n=1 Tax=Arundo donax TaxID=35708 RepID=A0A0A9AFI0_ARUDO
MDDLLHYYPYCPMKEINISKLSTFINIFTATLSIDR